MGPAEREAGGSPEGLARQGARVCVMESLDIIANHP